MDWIDTLSRGEEVVAFIGRRWQLARFLFFSMSSDMVYVTRDKEDEVFAGTTFSVRQDFLLERHEIKPVTPDNLLLIFGE